MEDVYRKLQKHLDKAPIGYPETKSGVEIRLLKHLFSEEEAKIALNLSILPETAEKILKRFPSKKMSLIELEKKLEKMSEKGSILGARRPNKGNKMAYQKIPLAIGMFELQVDRVTRELAEDFFAYEEEAFAEEFIKTNTKQMRTIPLNVRIDPEFHIGQYDSIRSIIKSSPGPFAVMNCVCRQAKDALDEPCKQTDIRQTCMMLEHSANFAMDRGVGEEVTREELLKLMTRAKKEGMVLQPENNQKPTFICCCCGCCCGVLTAVKKFDNPAEILHTNFIAEIIAEKCEGCEDCSDICQMEAIFPVNSHKEINMDRCIGCGLCISVCKQRAIKLLKRDKEIIPPKGKRDMYKKILFEKYGLIGSLKFAAKAAMGQKV